ncbi:MAG: hypothetical protein J5669_05925 [Bacteroidales bacterium]|nr:hypothetical protein [Bacteroidales bacterium]
MRKAGFWAVYALLLIAQLLFSNYCVFTPYVMLSILPVMVLCIPLRVGTTGAMLIAFATGLAVDLLAEGITGLNALALVPVALLRKPVIGLILGHDLFARGEDFSIRKNGFMQIMLALLLVQALFLAIYVWADAAGTRPLWFNAVRWGASMAAGILVSIPALEVMAQDTRK